LLSPLISNRDPLTTALIRKARNGEPGTNFGKLVAEGEGWRVLDVLCTAGPHDRPFAERHAWESISLVLSGTFAYRSDRGSSLISPGALVLGSVGRTFECSHQHGEGDRCLSFQFAPQLFEGIARDAGASRAPFHHDRLPPLRDLAPLTARAAAALGRPASLEEVGLELAGAVIQLEGDTRRAAAATATRDRARIASVLRHLDARSEEPHSLAKLASIAGLSRYHFLRTFKSVTGITPHQWILRARLREAAKRLVSSREPITEVALDVGFDDLSNFIRSFRAEFGTSPSKYRVSMS
jgi:AraC family transcriptional regulator